MSRFPALGAPAPLEPTELAALASASEGGVSRALVGLAPHLADDRWLGTRNYFRTESARAVAESAVGAAILGRRQKQLSEYVAASATLHCSDGWAYLGRALQSHLQGDPDTTRHLAYYAELRGALALLATQGVGVFRNHHIAVDSLGVPAVIPVRRPTHQATWVYLEWWAASAAATPLLGTVVTPYERTLDEWLVAMPTGPGWQPVATDWLKRFGLDLKVFAADRDARNEVSYRPTRLLKRVPLDAYESARFVQALWSDLEPTGAGSFALLDRYLLRLLLEDSFHATTGTTAGADPGAYLTAIEHVVAEVAIDAAEAARKFLTREANPDDPAILRHARVVDEPSSPTHHVSVMSRALLLLRVASGASRNLFRGAGVTADETAFWWGSLGRERGFWQDLPDADAVVDSWADVAEALDSLQEWMGGADHSQRDLVEECGASLVTIGNAELAGIWTIAS